MAPDDPNLPEDAPLEPEAPERPPDPFLAAAAGISTGIGCALVWAGITDLTLSPLYIFALPVGCLIGLAVAMAGKGSSPIYGMIGAVCTMFSCWGAFLLGLWFRFDFSAGYLESIGHPHASYLGLLRVSLGDQPGFWLFYAIGVGLAYWVSMVD